MMPTKNKGMKNSKLLMKLFNSLMIMLKISKNTSLIEINENKKFKFNNIFYFMIFFFLRKIIDKQHEKR